MSAVAAVLAVAVAVLHPFRVGSRPHVVSPDGALAAVGSVWDGDGRLRFVDVAARRVVYAPRVVFWPPTTCDVSPLLWSPTGLVFAVAVCADAHRTGASRLAVVDFRRRRVESRPIGLVLREARAAGRVVLLASPPLGPVDDGTYAREERLGPARLIRIDRDGSVAQLVLRIRAGYASSRTFNRVPGLAVRGDRAIVVAEGDGAADVDLRTLRVAYHRVPFPARPRSLAPSVPHTGTTNPSRDLVREAVWIGQDLVAVTGSDTWTRDWHDQSIAAGLRLLDVRRWRAPLVAPDADHVEGVVGRRLIVDERGRRVTVVLP